MTGGQVLMLGGMVDRERSVSKLHCQLARLTKTHVSSCNRLTVSCSLSSSSADSLSSVFRPMAPFATSDQSFCSESIFSCGYIIRSQRWKLGR